MNTRQPLDGRAVGLMLVLCLLWALQQIGLKATAHDFSPVLQIALRSAVAAVLVRLYMAASGERMDLSRRIWPPGLVIGLLFALEYLLVGEGLRRTSAAHIVVFLYTAPIFAALGLHWKLPSEKLAPLQWLGIGLAFAGIAVAFVLRDGSTPQGDMAQVVLGDVLGLLGGLAWGATTVVIRATPLSGLSASQTLLYQLLGAFALLLPGAFALGQTTFHPSAFVLAEFAFQCFIVSFASFLVWFWLLRHYLASRLGVFSFLTPLLGVVLGEHIAPAFVVGAGMVLAGIVLVGRKQGS
jgi:drug/metabolite transporter (DMT)-like permease